MTPEQEQLLIDHLTPFVTPHRMERIREVLPFRTQYITVVLEDIFQSFNASAVLRSCDCFGIQDVHAIESRNAYLPRNEVARGANLWVSLHRHSNTPDCFQYLKEQGYRIVATCPRADISIDELDPADGKIALVFGTERHGLTETARQLADERVKIPMVGFTESFNISVSAAICLHSVSNKLWKLPREQWQLSPEKTQSVYLDYLRSSVRAADSIEKQLFSSPETKHE